MRSLGSLSRENAQKLLRECALSAHCLVRMPNSRAHLHCKRKKNNKPSASCGNYDAEVKCTLGSLSRENLLCESALTGLSARQGFPAISRLAPLGRFLASSEVYPSGNNALVLSDRQGSFVNRSPLVGCRQRLQMSLYDCFCRPINLPGQSRARFFGSADV